jgi:superfamily II DNA/RNA helicase
VFISNVSTLIIDEFDTMLDGGYEEDLSKLIHQVQQAGLEQ